MANVDNAHGLRSLSRGITGGFLFTEELTKVVGYGTAIYEGDAVNRVADGSIEVSATPGTTLYSGVSLNYGAASKLTKHLVIVDPTAIFEAQNNGTLVAADMGLNANLILGAGNATTKNSGHQIAASTAQTTSTLDMKLLKMLDVPDNDPTLANARIVVMFNKHRMSPGVAGV